MNKQTRLGFLQEQLLYGESNRGDEDNEICLRCEYFIIKN